MSNTAIKWEYKVEKCYTTDRVYVEKILNDHGKDGWRLHHIVTSNTEGTMLCFFERPESSLALAIALSGRTT